MTNNYILKNLRRALGLDDAAMIGIFRMTGRDIDPDALAALLKKEDEQGYAPCSPDCLVSFLDGLIIYKRGAREVRTEADEAGVPTNNDILKRLRIALEFKEEDMLSTFRAGGATVSRSELSALFRKKGHKHYKECGDQFLRYFLRGLAIRKKR
jgi:uncharacterized protein YehS (DUF1456 family)